MQKNRRAWIIRPSKRWTVILILLATWTVLILAVRLTLALLDPILFERLDSWLRLVGTLAGVAMLLAIGWVVVCYRTASIADDEHSGDNH